MLGYTSTLLSIVLLVELKSHAFIKVRYLMVARDPAGRDGFIA